jgi:hypothetical protein
VLTSLPLARRIFDLETTTTLAVQAGIVSSRQAEIWAAEHIQADAAGQFFSSLTFSMVTGTKRD